MHTDTRQPRASRAAQLCKSFCWRFGSLPLGLSNDLGLREERKKHTRGAENTTVCSWKQAAKPHSRRRAPRRGRAATLPSSLGQEATPASGCAAAVAGRLRGAGGSRRSQRHAKLQVRQGDRSGEQERRQPGSQQQPEEGRQQAGAAHLPRSLLPLHG